jgi:hypothetical protein
MLSSRADVAPCRLPLSGVWIFPRRASISEAARLCTPGHSRRALSALALLLALAGPAFASQYIVDGGSPHAADTNPGTAAQPFKTIRHAADIVQAGDTVLIEPGTYAESITIRNSGTAAKPIVFQAATRHGVIVVAPDDHTYTLIHSGRLANGHLSSAYITLRGIVFGHTAYRGWSGKNDFPVSVGLGHGWRVEDCVLQDNMAMGFGNGPGGDRGNDSNDVTLLRTIFEDCNSGGLGAGGHGDSDPLQDVHVIDCIFRRNNPKNLDPGGYNGANKFLFVDHLVMDGVISYDNNGSGTWFDTGATNFTVKNCTFFGNHAGYALGLDGKPIGDTSWASGGFWSEANQGPGLIEGNVFYSNLAEGIGDMDSGSKGPIVIRNNWFVDNGGDGILFRGLADVYDNYGIVDRKAGSKLISDLTEVGTGGKYGSYAVKSRNVSWSNGAPTLAASRDEGYIWQNAASGNQGWSFTVPADATARTLSVLAGGDDAVATLTASLSDGSAPDYTTTQTMHGTINDLFTISYHAAGPGRTLTVTYVKSGVIDRPDGSADLDAAWLSDGGATPAEGLSGTVVPAADFYDLSSVGNLDWVHWGRIALLGDRLLGAADVEHNVFKANKMSWGTNEEEHVLARPADMGIVIDGNIYDRAPGDDGPWVKWKPTAAAEPITAVGLAQMQQRLGVEAHGKVKQMSFRGPLIHVYSYPTAADALSPDPAKLQEVPSQDAERNTIDRAIARQHGAAGRIVTIPVYGHTPISGSGKQAQCQVYDLQARYVRLALSGAAAQKALERKVTPYAIIAPTSVTVRLTRVSPYNIEAVFIK